MKYRIALFPITQELLISYRLWLGSTEQHTDQTREKTEPEDSPLYTLYA